MRRDEAIETNVEVGSVVNECVEGEKESRQAKGETLVFIIPNPEPETCERNVSLDNLGIDGSSRLVDGDGQLARL